MCPACLSILTLAVAGATSAGGVTALLTRRRAAHKEQNAKGWGRRIQEPPSNESVGNANETTIRLPHHPSN
jgi:hypothetical protein